MISKRFEHNDNEHHDITDRIIEKWESEPEFVDLKLKHYHLVIWRHPEMGHLNGYVGVKRGHPCFGKNMNHKTVYKLSVHWGITFAGERTTPGFKKGYWYFGFDTAHAFDYPPYLQQAIKEMEEMDHPFIKELNEMMKPLSNLITIKPTKNFYKDIHFVTDEVEKLYSQLYWIKKNNPQIRHSHKKEYREKHKLKLIQRRKQL